MPAPLQADRFPPGFERVARDRPARQLSAGGLGRTTTVDDTFRSSTRNRASKAVRAAGSASITTLPWLIDVVEPFQPLDPADAPKAKSDLAPARSAAGTRTFLSPFAVDAAIEASNGGLVPLASLDLLARAKRRLGETKTWELSTLFGAAVVAAGGFHLAMRESERFKTRWLPSRAAFKLPDRPLARFPRSLDG